MSADTKAGQTFDEDSKMPHFLNAIREGNLNKVAEMAKNDRRYLTSTDIYGDSAIRRAVESRQKEILSFLIGAGASINPVIDNQWRPTHHCIEHSDMEMLEFVLQNGASTEEQDFDRDTPITKAVRLERLEAIPILTKYGANLNVRIWLEDCTPLRLAQRRHYEKIIDLLRSLGAKEYIKEV